jgi:hypothetical protein
MDKGLYLKFICCRTGSQLKNLREEGEYGGNVRYICM